MKVTIISILSIVFGAIILVAFPNNTYDSFKVACNSKDYATRVFCLTNDYRQSKNKTPLIYSPELVEVSRSKSEDMCKNKYFSHDYNGRSWTYFINESPLKYNPAGENLAKGFTIPLNAVQALIKSPGHEANLSGDYTHLGVYTEYCNGLNLTTQTFVKL